jgi:hypothetical protein
MRSRNFNIDNGPRFPFKLFGCTFSIMGIIIAAVVVLFASSFLWNATGGMQELATKEATKYAAHLPGVTSIECNRYDTDADGYVTCTLFRGDTKPLQIECGYSGCRMPKLMVPQE